MAISRQWTEWHLTPAGWVSGSSRRDGQGNVWRDEPEDRIITFVYQEQMDKAHPEPHATVQESWRSKDAGAAQHRTTTRPAWSLSAKALASLVFYAVVLEHSSFMARVSSWAIMGAVAVSMAERCIRYTSLPSRRMAIAGEVGG